jgi:hypothetical protein
MSTKVGDFINHEDGSQTVDSTHGHKFASSAIVDTTNATNIKSGKLLPARLPLATDHTVGAVKPDGETIKVNDEGSLSVVGLIKGDGITVLQDADGVLSVKVAEAVTIESKNDSLYVNQEDNKFTLGFTGAPTGAFLSGPYGEFRNIESNDLPCATQWQRGVVAVDNDTIKIDEHGQISVAKTLKADGVTLIDNYGTLSAIYPTVQEVNSVNGEEIPKGVNLVGTNELGQFVNAGSKLAIDIEGTAQTIRETLPVSKGGTGSKIVPKDGEILIAREGSYHPIRLHGDLTVDVNGEVTITHISGRKQEEKQKFDGKPHVITTLGAKSKTEGDDTTGTITVTLLTPANEEQLLHIMFKDVSQKAFVTLTPRNRATAEARVYVIANGEGFTVNLATAYLNTEYSWSYIVTR